VTRPYTIPSQADLEVIGYDPHEIKVLCEAAKQLNPVADPAKRCEYGRRVLRALWPDELEFLSKQHWIATKTPGVKVLLRPNYAQRRFYSDVIEVCREEKLPIRGIILKARQLGFSTFIQSWQYEQCDRADLRLTMTVSYDDDSTKELFGKAKLIHDNLWFPRTAKRASKGVMEFDNRSAFYARTAGNTRVGRSLTLHHVHCSEIPTWDDAEEALTSLTSCVPLSPDSSMFYESTAKGAYGPFYEAWTAADEGNSEFIPFFAPWFWDPNYVLPFPDDDRRKRFGREMLAKDRRYMERHKLSLEQMRWRDAKIKEFQGSVRRFQQEFPAEPMEAFLTTGSPAFDPEKVAELASNAVGPLWSGDAILQR
jgi:hypothetical protein